MNQVPKSKPEDDLTKLAFPGLGDGLRKLRGEASTTEWAERLGITQSAVSKYENGQLSVPATVISKIAEELKSDPDVVLVYLLKTKYPRLGSTDYELGQLVDEFATGIEL